MSLRKKDNFRDRMWKMLKKSAGFMGCTDDYTTASAVILGVPMDFTTTFRHGTSLGPLHIRLLSEGLEEYSLQLDRDLADYIYYDAGDVILPPGDVKEGLRRIKSVAEHFLSSKKFLLVLGGEHLLSLPVIEAVSRLYPALAVLHFDAHADLRNEYQGATLSHATVMRRVADAVGGDNIFQAGIRSSTRQELVYARLHTNLFPEEVASSLDKILSAIRNRPVYITLDIDVVDPAYAPGTGAPEPGGCTPQEIIQALHCLKSTQVVGMDLVEVNPVYDPSGRTSLLAAKLVREAILCFARQGDS